MESPVKQSSDERLTFGANVVADGVEFRVWAPSRERVDVVLYGPDAERVEPLAAEEGGWWSAVVAGAGAGTRYKYRLNGGDAFPDPASRSQPDGVHEASEVVDPSAFAWTDAGWKGVPYEDLVIYELHVGTATEEGTFDALIGRLDDIAALGATAVEPLPIAEFPGHRNWGYDGVFLYAPESSYGGADAFRRFVDAAHARGLAVVLDVVYNHLGPEGNYLPAITGGRYFTDRHCTPWGDAIDYAARPVREFAIQNALHWAREYHVDGLRMDATHAILDDSPLHVIAEMVQRVHASLPEGRHFAFMAEDERNESSLVLPPPTGWGIDGVWADDFHHQVRRHTAGDHEAYFQDYTGSAEDIVRTLLRGWYYEGQRSVNHDRPRGTPTEGMRPTAFIHCIQNHDQVGNRALGDRLTESVSLPVYRALSALLLLSPYTPLLWMGQEWAATTPFQYFTDHPEELGKLVTEGRRKEFGKFSAFADPKVRERIPDPQAPSTFANSRLRWDEAEQMPHAGIRALYRELLALRHSLAPLRRRDRESLDAHALGARALSLRRTGEDGSAVLLVASFDEGGMDADLLHAPATCPPRESAWVPLLSTEEARFGGDDEGEVVSVGADGRIRMRGAGAVVLVAEKAGSRE